MSFAKHAHARVYLGPEPELGPHPGYQGLIIADALGVHIGEDCEYLHISDGPAEWPDSDWVPVMAAVLLPWHRVHEVQWQEVSS